jgi:hypothetical protein
MEEMENDLVSIMRAHFVDTARGDDIDKLGALFNIKRNDVESDPDYSNRLKMAILSFKGGGTIDAIQMLVRITLGLPQNYSAEIVENPPVRLMRTWTVSSGHEWLVNPRNIQDTIPEITITVETENATITDPTLTNLTTGENITFKGDISYGDSLKIGKDRAMLNGEDRTDRLSTTSFPRLPRTKSKWQYTEYKGANIGTFDQTNFDDSVFVIDITSSVTFEWTAYQPATFEMLLPEELLQKAGFTAGYMQDIINSVKASGVKADVKVIK